MKPVDQTLFGDKIGNCYQACIASILEVPIEKVPNIHEHEEGPWVDIINRFLEPYAMMILPGIKAVWPFWIPENTYHIIGGKSPRGEFGHAVVGLCRKIIHDPHPSRAGLAGNHDDWHYDFLLARPERIAAIYRENADWKKSDPYQPDSDHEDNVMVPRYCQFCGKQEGYPHNESCLVNKTNAAPLGEKGDK
jgi:hypothetical protein